MCWRRLYRVLSTEYRVNTRQHLFPSRGASVFLVKILYWQCKRWALCKVSSSTFTLMKLRSGLRDANSCVKMILHALWTILNNFNPGESWHCHPGIWSWYVFLHGCLRNEKLHTPSLRVKRTVAKHITC